MQQSLAKSQHDTHCTLLDTSHKTGRRKDHSRESSLVKTLRHAATTWRWKPQVSTCTESLIRIHLVLPIEQSSAARKTSNQGKWSRTSNCNSLSFEALTSCETT